jgi:hypothetical protein
VRRVLLTDNPRYLRKVSVGLRQQRVEEDVLHQKGAIVPDLCLIVATVGEELDQEGEAVVGGAGRPVRG